MVELQRQLDQQEASRSLVLEEHKNTLQTLRKDTVNQPSVFVAQG